MKLPRFAIAIALLAVTLASAAQAQVTHVIQISVDGLSAKLLTQYLKDSPADYPTFKRFVDEGATTLNARTDFTHTITLPNHTSMLTGRPVMPPEGKPLSVAHNYTQNTDPPDGMTLHTANPEVPYMSSTVEVVHDHGLTTGFYASKSKFSLFTTSYDDKNGAACTPPGTGAAGTDSGGGRNKVDHLCLIETPGPASAPKLVNSAQMHDQLLKDLPANHPNYTFIHYRDPDSAGHLDGWDSPAYRTAVHNVDTRLGQLLTLVSTDPNFRGHTIVILTADHGGIPTTKQHSLFTSPHAYTIPFLVWGAGVKHADLYQLNSTTRTDPAADRPDYNAPGQPIRNGDAGNLALKLLGLPAIPGSSINAAQDLTVN